LLQEKEVDTKKLEEASRRLAFATSLQVVQKNRALGSSTESLTESLMEAQAQIQALMLEARKDAMEVDRLNEIISDQREKLDSLGIWNGGASSTTFDMPVAQEMNTSDINGGNGGRYSLVIVCRIAIHLANSCLLLLQGPDEGQKYAR
jgi:hypothetical protein